MQLRIVYSSFAHVETRDAGGSLLSASDTNDDQFPSYTKVRPLYTPSAIVTAVSETDAQLAAILGAIGSPYAATVTPYANPFFGPFIGLIGTGLMPDGNQFIELNLTPLIDNVFDDWQWYVDNDPTSTSLPAGFSSAWMTRRADVHTFKSNAANHAIQIETGKHNLYSGDENATIVPSDSGLLYLYGLPTIVEAWVYDIGTGALLATDANMTVSSFPNPSIGIKPSDFETYEFILSGGAAQKFWTNFHACVEDV